MPALLRCTLSLAILLLPVVTYGQQKALPCALILGDSVYRQPASETAKELRGKVEVVFASTKSGEVCNTSTVLENLDTLLGKTKWDVIHFNFGLGDLVYRAPGMKSFRLLPYTAGGVRATSPEQYENNLRAIVRRLKTTGAKLIWASTTPIRHSSTNVFEKGSEVQYNAIAAKVMSEEGVAVSDMYAYVVELIDMNRPAGHGADPFFFDRKPLHPPIVRSLRRELNVNFNER